MQLKTFQAADMRTALAAVKHELGPEALVVATRTIPGGFLSSSRVEITAAIEASSLRLPAPEASGSIAASPPSSLQRFGQQSGGRRYADSHRREPRPWAAGLDEDLQKLATRLATRLTLADVEPDIAQRLGSLVARRCASASGELHEGSESASPTASDVRHGPAGLEGYETPELPEVSDGVYARALASLITERLGQVQDPCQGDHVRLALVGATGVGKTTTIAKLAAHAALVLQKRVALVSVDTYRVGALEQLRAYADLMQVPLTIARDPASFGKALRTHQQADLVLIDTAGRGPQDAEQVPSLTAMFADHGVRTCIAVAANTRRYEVRRVLERYRPLLPSAAIFTKLDEASVGGALLNVVAGGGVPLSYVTFGQRVPEDIARAQTTRLAEFIAADGEASVAFESWEGMVHRFEQEPA